MSLLLEKHLIIVENRNRMKKTTLFILLVFISRIITAQNILSINDNNISLEEFKNVFYKNNNTEITKEYLDEYIDLFINFKLKVKEAESLQMDTIPAFISELDGYRKQLIKPYLKNQEFDDKLILEAYERMQYDIRASHILIKLNEKATQKEKENAYNKALKIREDILSKKISFSAAAKKYSDDKSAILNNGDLGYFTTFRMVYEVESAAYNTVMGNISTPVLTKFGYHLVKVTDKRSSVGQVKVAHIMFKTGEGVNENKIKIAKQKIDEISIKLKSGEDFSDLAEKFSQDRSSAVKGGLLPMFSVGKMVPAFEKEAFSLKNIGDISKPFQTDFGWHIIKLVERKEIGSFEQMKNDIKQKIIRDSRSQLSEKALYQKLKKEYKVKNIVSSFVDLRRSAVQKVSIGNWSGNYSKGSNILFTINSKKYIVNEFIEYILLNQKSGSDFDIMYQDFVNSCLLEYEKSMLHIKYPEYKTLLNEYREGILLFDLTNKKVWKKAIEDTIGLQLFYENNIDSYLWDNRIDATIYTCKNLNTARNVKHHIFRKNFIKDLKDDVILKKLNNDDPLTLQIMSKKFIEGENQYIDKIIRKKGLAKDIVLDDKSVIVINVHDIIPSAPKKLSETRGKVISDYQNKLEKEWILELKSKYKVVVNKDVLYSLIK